MKNLFTWISDVHISLKNLDVSIQVLIEALNKSRELKIPLFISGDLNDTKAIMRSEWVSALINLFNDYKDVEVYIMTGNHDMDNKNALTHSLEFLKPLSNIKVIDKPSVHYINGCPFFCIPYCINVESFRDALKLARANGIKKLIAHQGILGSFMGDYLVDESSIDPKEIADFEIVLLGHYHKFQKNLNYIYCGSPYTVNVGEADQTKFIHVVKKNNEVIELDHYETLARRHYKAIIESDEDIKALSPKLNSIAHIVLKGPKEFIKKYNDTEKFKSILNAQSVTIIPEMDRQSEHRISAEILHSPLKVIDAYLTKADTILNKDILKDYLFKISEDLLTTFTSNTSKTFTIKRATAKNFLSFKELDFNYSSMGLTLVEGFDEDTGLSPGSGKSSFFDVVLYGLFGQTSKDIKADEVINRLAKKNCEVILYLNSTDGEYQLKRYRKHSEFDNDLALIFPNGKELRGKDNKETQKLIEQELGCSYDLFLKSSYFTQFGAIDRFLSASDTEKKKLISDITDLSIYDDILVKVKSSIKTQEEILNIQEKSLLEAQTKFDSTKRYLSQDEIQKDQWEQNKQNNLQLLNGKKNNWELNQDALIYQAKSFSLNFSVEIEEQIKKLEDERKIFEMNKEASIKTKEQKIIDVQKQLEQASFDVHEYEKQKNNFVNVDDQIKKLDEKLKIIEDLKIIKQKHQSEIYNLEKEIASINQKIAIEKKKMEDNKNGSCHFCHQSISPSLIESVISHYELQLLPLEESKKSFLSKIAELEPYLDKTKIESDKSELINQRFKVQSINDLIQSKNNQIVLLERNIESLKNEILNLETTKSDVAYKIEIVKQKQNPHIEKISQLEKEVNPYIREIETLNLSVNPFIQSIELKNKDLSLLENQVDDQLLKVNFTKQELTYGEFWKQALHVYIKSYLMDSCLDQLNELTNEYLNTLFDGILQFNISAVTEANKEVKEKISVSIINNGDECSYQSLSGGERCRICLALNLALSQVIMKTNGKNFGMIFLDEILNGLDEVGKTQTMRLLKELELQYQSVFIIDHSTEFKALFTNSIMIKKKDKISYLV